MPRSMNVQILCTGLYTDAIFDLAGSNFRGNLLLSCWQIYYKYTNMKLMVPLMIDSIYLFYSLSMSILDDDIIHNIRDLWVQVRSHIIVANIKWDIEILRLKDSSSVDHISVQYSTSVQLLKEYLSINQDDGPINPTRNAASRALPVFWLKGSPTS